MTKNKEVKNKETKKIEINRNQIEKILLDARELLKKNTVLLVRTAAVLILLIIIGIGGLVFLDYRSDKQMKEYDKIIETYKDGNVNDPAHQKATIEKFKKLADSAFWGFQKRMSYYNIATIYFSMENYKDSAYYYQKFADSSATEVMKLLALQKSAVALEEIGKYDDALKIYNNISKNHENSFLEDQVLYNKGRLFVLKKDYGKARAFFNRVITSAPKSIFAKKAKRQLFMLAD